MTQPRSSLRLTLVCTGIGIALSTTGCGGLADALAATPTAATSTASISTVPLSSPGPVNEITVNNPAKVALTNYPLQIGRAFREGEIPSGQCPVFSEAGSNRLTQTDVKNRWADGSVKFAVLSTLVPSLAPASKRSVRIIPGSCPSTAASSAARMLEAAPDFDIALQFSGGINARVSARDMMAAGAVRSWGAGPVMNSWIVTDHVNKAFDVGTDANKSVRPIFHVQQWEGLDLYRVRVVIEISDTTKMQDQLYAVKITSGRSNPAVLFETGSLTHILGSRWSREFWIGSAKPVSMAGIGHGVAYLASTKAIPNYDPTISVSSQVETSFLSSWATTAKGVFEGGFWQKTMASAGGRSDIGIFPSWHVAMLYSDNPDLQQAVRQLSDLAGTWAMHFRSGINRPFDSVTKVNGFGLPVTRDGYPTQFAYQGNQYLNSYMVSLEDQFTVVGPNKGLLGWSHDAAHQPDPWYLTYLLTGDFWYLEQLQFWASWGLFNTNAGSALWASGRDPRDAVINDQLRGMAWLLRTRARAAWASPDGSPERAYFTRTTEQALRAMEGSMIGAGGTDPIRAWWANAKPRSSNPLRYVQDGFSGASYMDGIPRTGVASSDNPWMISMMIQSWGHLAELGFGSQELLSWVSQGWNTMASTPGVDPRHLADYRIPVMKTSGGFFQTWNEAFEGYANWSSSWENNLGDLEHGYTIFAIAAMSYLKNETGGTAAWAWVDANGYKKANWPMNPKMAILPR